MNKDVEEDAPVGYTWIVMMLMNEEAQQVGSWSTEAGLDIKDIVWPNESRVPPKVSTNYQYENTVYYHCKAFTLC